MNVRSIFTIILLSLILGGCATTPQSPVYLSKEATRFDQARIGVAMTSIPKVDILYPGADCLLCLGAASIMNASLATHTQTLPIEGLPNLKNDLADLLRQKGAEVVVIDNDLNLEKLPDARNKGENLASKDFSSLKEKYNLDKLLVISINHLGVIRQYAGYIPTSAPMARISGSGSLINLSTNSYEWYLPLEVLRDSDGSWDEPPTYPGVTSAYFQALEIGKDNLLKPFSN